MKIGLLSDAHGNALGTEKCLRFLKSRHVEALYFLGDAVGYLPQEQKVLDLLEEYGAMCQKGNHEAMLLGDLQATPERERLYQLEPTRHRLSESQRQRIAAWPVQREVKIGAHNCLMVHASPWKPLEEYIYEDTDCSRFDSLPYQAIFMGHTHRPFIVRRGETLIVNVGSCGLPRDDGRWLSCVIYDGSSHEAELFRLPSNAEEFLANDASQGIASEVKALFTERRSERVPGRQIQGDC